MALSGVNEEIVRREIVEKVPGQRREDVKPPIAIYQSSPIIGDPFGVCIADLIHDKDYLMNSILDAQAQKEKYNA